MEGLTAALLFGAVVLKLSDLLKFITSKKYTAAATQVGVFVIGTVAVVLAAHSNFASGITLAGASLTSTNGAGQVLLGIVAGSTAGALYDTKRAIDNTDSAATGTIAAPAENA